MMINMKRIFLFFVTFILTNGFAQAQKAKDNLQVATNAVKSRATDAQLLDVVSNPGSSVSISGDCFDGWMYTYISILKDSIYVAGVNSGQASIAADSISIKQYTLWLDNTGSTWINSDAAISTAEQKGGSSYRLAHADASCLMVLKKGVFPADTTKTV